MRHERLERTRPLGVPDLQTALDFALEASKVAARTVVESFLSGEEPRSSERYLLSMNWNSETKVFDHPCVKAIAHDAVIAPLSGLAKMIADDTLPSDQELADIAKACLRRLKSRHVW